MRDAQAAIDNLKFGYQSVDTLIRELSVEQLATQSYCPAWSVQGVVGHLVAVEAVMARWVPASSGALPPFEKAAPIQEQAAKASPADLLALYRETTVARSGELDALSPEQLAAPCGTPVGPGTYGAFLSIRVFDFWVHEQDIRGPLSLPGNESGPAAEEALEQTLSTLPYIVGKRIGLPQGMSVRIVLTGPIELERCVRVDRRAALVDSLESPTVELTADSTVFQLLACGRIDPQGPIDSGTISWSGDQEWGERAARNLRYTM